MRAESPETLRLRSTFRPDRHDPARRRVPVCNWRPRRADLQGLSRTALTFVRRACARFWFNDKAGALVLASADALDRLAALDKAIGLEGEQVAGTRGRLKINPKLRERRRLERRLGQVLNHLELTDLWPE
jgi:hypothetical protein